MRRRNQRKQAIYRPAFGRRYRALATPSSTAPSEILQIYSNEVNENMPVERRSAKPSSASRPAQTAPRSGSDAKLATKSRPDRIPTMGLMQSSTTESHTRARGLDQTGARHPD
ncbi:hypothetical protein U1Q18_025602 [Sarracenia purpurea var. burkii]